MLLPLKKRALVLVVQLHLKNVLVSVPQLDTAPKFEIDLPSSTVTLAANGETATYDEVTATTAANTLVLGKGITVNTLKVKAGKCKSEEWCQSNSHQS